MINSEILKPLTVNLKAQRNLAIEKAAANTNIANQNAEYVAVMNEIGLINFEIAKAKYNNNDFSSLEKELESLTKKRIQILKKLNLKSDDLKPHFSCKKCEDTGVCDNKVCMCLYRQYTEKLKEMCGNKLDTSLTFAEYDENLHGKDSDVAKACTLLKQFVSKYPNVSYNNILLSGPIGIGKTFLTQAVANALIDKGVFTLFVSSFVLNQNFLKFHTAKDKENDVSLDTFFDCDLLIIDDLGTEPTYKNVTQEYFILLLNERIQNGKLTLLSTNLTIDEVMQKYGERIFSRLIDKRHTLALNLKGEDLRIKRK